MDMLRKIFFAIIILLLLPFLVSAADYYVAKDGSGDYSSIQAASNVAQPGDTVYIKAGTYGETIRPARSGSAGNYITFKNYQNDVVTINPSGDGIELSGRSYIIVDGIRIDIGGDWVKMDGSSTYNTIQNCYMENSGSWEGFLIQGTSTHHNKILNNVIIGRTGPDDVIYMRDGTHHNLIEGNQISYGPHNAIDFQDKTNSNPMKYNIIRNNIISNPWHTCINLWTNSDLNLVEGNQILDCGEDHANNIYGSERDRTMSRENHGSIQLGSSKCIIRKNLFIGTGSITMNTYDFSTAHNNRIYHNTFNDNYIGITSSTSYLVTGNIMKNNIFFNNRNHELKMVMGSGSHNYFINNNIKGAPVSVSPYGTWTGNIEQNPLFVNENARDLHLQSGSPMIDAADWLTKTTNSGSSSTNILVEDASYFMDGWGIIEGDLIQLQGQATTARITNVNYGSNTITVNTPLTWSTGTGVALAYEGSAPDIGAYEYGGTTPPPPTCSNCKPNPCSTYTDCTTGTGTCTGGMYCCLGTCTETPPPTCSGECKTNPCNTYDDCTTATGTCPAGEYCCQGACTEPAPPPTTCSGECKTNPCNTYTDCTTGTGTCPAGEYCCQGACTETQPPPPTCSGDCKTNPCSTYDDCTTATGTCTSGYCCSGSCQAQQDPCEGVIQCINGDGCCPAGCTQQTDNDCPPAGGDEYETQNSQDTRVSSGFPNYNYGSMTDYFVGARQDNHRERVLIKFPNLISASAVPQDSTISSATLTLTSTGTQYITSPIDLRLRRVLESWTEGSTSSAQASTGESTWDYKSYNNQRWASDTDNNGGSNAGCSSPQSHTATGEASTSFSSNPAEGSQTSFDVTQIVQHWATNGENSNHGFILIAPNQEGSSRNYVRFASSEHSTPAYRPRLTVSYEGNGGGGGGECIPGDMPPCNQLVDLFDLIFVTSRFGTAPSDTNWDPAADVAQPSNIIDIFDVVFVASRIS